MQNTRLNTLIDVVIRQLRRWLINPWRRLSLLVISFLLGTFLGTAVPTTAGQTAGWDVTGAFFLVVFTEGASWLVYRRARQAQTAEIVVPMRSFLAEMLNALKIGLTYSLFVEAFKLGS